MTPALSESLMSAVLAFVTPERVAGLLPQPGTSHVTCPPRRQRGRRIRGHENHSTVSGAQYSSSMPLDRMKRHAVCGTPKSAKAGRAPWKWAAPSSVFVRLHRPLPVASSFLPTRCIRSTTRTLLAPLYDSFSEGYGTPDLVHARAVLDAL